MRAAIYCRISQDSEGKGEGVERQEKECRTWCEENGYDVARVYVDNDISAMGKKVRPEYELMLKGIANRDFDVVVAWHFDRLTRSPKELENYIDLIGDDGIP